MKVYHTSYEDLTAQDGTKEEVTDEAGLIAALETRGTDGVSVKADITVHSDMIVRKRLIIDKDCSLTMADGASLTVYGNAVVLEENAALKGSSITLQEDAILYMINGSNLAVEEGGSLTLDSSLLCGWNGDIQMDKARFVLKNRAGMAFETVNALHMVESTVTLQDQSVFVLPMHYGEADLGGSVITLAKDGGGSYFYTISDTVLQDCSLQIEDGVFYNSASSVNLSNCDISIGQDGEWNSHLSNLSLNSGTTLRNEGFFQVNGWHEHLFTLHGSMTNYGTMEFSIDLELSQPIDNQGTVRYYGEHYRGGGRGWNDADVSGNAPVDVEQ